MLNWPELAKQLRQIINTVIRFIKARRREEASLAIAALLFSGGYAVGGNLLPELRDAQGSLQLNGALQAALYALGAAFFVYAAWRLWRLAQAPEMPPVVDRPSAIKGPTAFTPEDGALFRKLGREGDLQELMGYVLDDQASLLVLMGESGVGKTSLLRAGLPHILAGKGVKVHYWEAVPSDSAERLLQAIQTTWNAPANGAGQSTAGTTAGDKSAPGAVPAALDDLVNPAAALCPEPHVIVLDQFEQLRGRNPIFQLLRRVIREARPPHRITWIVAFRREFRADWSDFIIPEQKRGFFPKEMSMRLFTAEQARDVISQLIQEATLSVQQLVVNNLIEAAANDKGEVSPVDIGVGLLALAELHDRQGRRTVSIHDYRFAGGAEGLLTQYINRCLERFPEPEREAILKALLALRDPATNQRIAEGLTIEKLAAEVDAEPRRLQPQLDRLAQRDIRLLESFTTPDEPAAHYRLPHERLIPALHRLMGKLLGEIEQARLRFENAFLAWQKNEKRAHYLLKGADLRLVERCASQIPWGRAEQEKQSFLRRSQRRRSRVRAVAVATAIALVALGWVGALQYQHYEGRRYLSESGYPPELYDYQHQLKKLELTEPLDLERFTWLSSDSIEELNLHATSSSNSIAGLSSLARCRSLKKLTLDLSGSQGSNLPIFVPSGSQVSDLEPLAKLSNLTQLTLDLNGSQVNDLEPLAKLDNLTHLTLSLSRSRVSNFEPLAKLKKLTHLTLDLRMLPMVNLEPFTKLSNLTQLTLDLSGSLARDFGQLAKLSNQTQLNLKIAEISASNLEQVATLNNLTQLTLYPSEIPKSPLESLAKLNDRTQLTLDLRRSDRVDLEPLAKLSNRTQLNLLLGRIQASNLESLAKLENLTQLTIFLDWGQAVNLEPLAKLSNLTDLTLSLDGRSVVSLEPLAKLSNLTDLTLSLSYNQVNDLDPLAKLGKLTRLTLYLSGIQISNLESLAKPSNLMRLTLDLSGNQVSDLEPLAKWGNLAQLKLKLSGSQMSTFEPLSKLAHLHALSVESATRAQRISLRHIPPSLVELKF